MAHEVVGKSAAFAAFGIGFVSQGLDGGIVLLHAARRLQDAEYLLFEVQKAFGDFLDYVVNAALAVLAVQAGRESQNGSQQAGAADEKAHVEDLLPFKG